MSFTVSIVICTDGRSAGLQATLQSLRQLDYSDFEVVVVYGPTPDGTRELLGSWGGAIKCAPCLERNLSKSRNIGISHSAGDIVAFLDDDAIPEPEWLEQIVSAYTDDNVGAAGGFVHDHTGASYQYRFGTADRLGGANLGWERAAPELCVPNSANFPHLLGANSSFRRSALLSVGGFDEEFDYYLDETDLAARIVDAGWHIVQIAGAYVHHKFMASALRSEQRVLTSWYSVFKNKIYFGLVHRHGHHGVADVLEEARTFIGHFRNSVEECIDRGLLAPDGRDDFARDIERAWTDGLTRGLVERRCFMSVAAREAVPDPFARFPDSLRLMGGQTFCLVSRQYPPAGTGDAVRYIHELAKGLVDLGHQVHVLTQSAEHDRVDLDDGVWVHRIDLRPSENILAGSPAMLEAIDDIIRRRPVDCVYAPCWEREGFPTRHSANFSFVFDLPTAFKSLTDQQATAAADTTTANFYRSMIAMEQELIHTSHALEPSISEAGDITQL